jgi:hypothetical protein
MENKKDKDKEVKIFERHKPLIPCISKKPAFNEFETAPPPEIFTSIPEEVVNQILDGIKLGLSVKDACCRVGIDPVVFTHFVQSHLAEIQSRLDSARLTPRIVHLKRILEGAKNWQCSAWYLERTDRKQFGRELTIRNDDAAEEKQKVRFGDTEIVF